MQQTMVKTSTEFKPDSGPGFIDIVLYILAGSAMTILSISFLLWLRF
ncbi:MAG: hypothetical protein RQ723_12250 [Desulfuromonadales bacterium]|nr:hypothetical protein [Desulfuromonadales bacterium]